MGNFDISRIGKSFENNELSTEQKKKVEELENSIFDVSNMGLESDEDIGDLLNFSFDEDGNISMEIDIDGNGEIDHVETYKFDDEGNITESITNTLDEVTGETLDTKQSTMEYDDSGRISTKTFTNSTGEDALTYTKTFDYGDENSTNVKSASWQSSNESDVSRKVEYNDDGSYKETLADPLSGETTEFYYDNNNNITQGFIYDANNNVTAQFDCVNNDDGSKVITTSTTESSEIEEYDNSGNLIKSEVFDNENNLIESTEYTFSDSQNYTAVIKDSDGNINLIKDFAQNDDGSYSTTFKNPEGDIIYSTENNIDGSYAMNYFDKEGNIYKTEEYDADGGFVSSTDTE